MPSNPIRSDAIRSGAVRCGLRSVRNVLPHLRVCDDFGRIERRLQRLQQRFHLRRRQRNRRRLRCGTACENAAQCAAKRLQPQAKAPQRRAPGSDASHAHSTRDRPHRPTGGSGQSLIFLHHHWRRGTRRESRGTGRGSGLRRGLVSCGSGDRGMRPRLLAAAVARLQGGGDAGRRNAQVGRRLQAAQAGLSSVSRAQGLSVHSGLQKCHMPVWLVWPVRPPSAAPMRAFGDSAGSGECGAGCVRLAVTLALCPGYGGALARSTCPCPCSRPCPESCSPARHRLREACEHVGAREALPVG